MKKIRLFAMIVLSMMATAGYAQIQLGLQAGPQFPLGDFSSGYNTGMGLNASARYMVTDDVAAGLNIGYNHFKTDYDDFSCSLMPITLFADYTLSTNVIRPYLGFDLGLYNFSWKWKFGSTVSRDSELHFGIAPKAGIGYALNDNMELTGEFKWNYVMGDNGNDIDWFGFNVGLLFSL